MVRRREGFVRAHAGVRARPRAAELSRTIHRNLRRTDRGLRREHAVSQGGNGRTVRGPARGRS